MGGKKLISRNSDLACGYAVGRNFLGQDSRATRQSTKGKALEIKIS